MKETYEERKRPTHQWQDELFDVKGKLELGVVILLHYSSENTVMELYVKFPEADEASPSSTTVVANARAKAETRHSVRAFDFNFSGSMTWSESTYIKGLSTYNGTQSDAEFSKYMGYKRTNDLLPTIKSNEGVSNLFVEDDNEGINDVEDATKEEGVADIVDGSESDPGPI
ncbi:hypothetical protein PVK06_017612 [Gossypium arboreum]|uniref:Uncharacterized protein n=1 Tax=Gossypium arboreum TaxID=29729 RepID=A0ABR0Q3I7_GOSAR|nr:hypothetical protein PVK06_017612 [Gossypium arboreum]